MALTVPTTSFKVSTNYSNFDMYLNVTVGGVTQTINGWFRNPNYVEPEWGEPVNVDTMEELRAALAQANGGAKQVYVNYHGTEDVTLTDALTIPWTASVNFVDACNFTVGSGGVLTLESGLDDAARFILRKNSFTVADGGKVVGSKAHKNNNTYTNIQADHITMAQGSQLEVQTDGLVILESWDSSQETSFVLEAGAVVKANDTVGVYTGLYIRDFDKATLAGQINAVNYGSVHLENDVNEISGTITINGNGKRGYMETYGDTTITETGKVEVSGRNSFVEMYCPLTNKGTIALSGNAHGIFTNTGYAQHNEGTITIGSGSHIECQGTKLINTGTISGAGELIMNLGDDTTDYGDRFTGVEYVSVDYNESTPSNYSRYKFVRDPAATVEVTLYKAELVNEQGGTCTAQTNTEEFPES